MRSCTAAGYDNGWQIEPYGTPPFP
jgi:hypothetical protein